MVSLLRTLQDSEPALLPLLAAQWGIKIDPRDRETAIKQIANAMLDPAQAERAWEQIEDAQRGALQVLVSNQGQMSETMFSRLFGEIRRMGAAQIERERPHERPQGTAEALFYRGLIGIGYEATPTGPRALVYIPDDLLAALPVRKTSYDDLDDEDEDYLDEEDTPALTPVLNPENPRPADTSIVDDMTTLLAHVQTRAPQVGQHGLSEIENLQTYLLVRDPLRLVFLIELALSAELIELQTDRLYVRRNEARRWLGAPRSEQLRTLVQAWRVSERLHDLWHVPGLLVEREAGTMPQYNPAAPRETALDLLANSVPGEGWWPQDAYINAMKLHDRDFQRPNGDYSSWYIRNADGDYLTGEESWDAVDGALLHYYLNGPLHWLGLLDLADNAARLTAYGRALIHAKPWPSPPETTDKLTLQDDGSILVPRRASRIDRFQVARFAAWVSAGDPYVYRLDRASIAQAAEQGISASHIAGFLSKAAGDISLPPAIARVLENWRVGASAQVTFERLVVLRTTSVETLDFIYETPDLRRYLGARLGPMAVVIRADQGRALQTALGEHGIEVELIGF